MKTTFAWLVIFTLILTLVPSDVFAVNTATHGKMSGKTVVAGLLSFLIWPGIGQVVNQNETKKDVTHGILGLTGVFRFWSGWDALIDRQGGRWDGKI